MRPARSGSIAQTITVPAPVGGWNARDVLSAMAPGDAVILDNWFPDTDGVKTRAGSTAWATGLPGAVESLMDYVPSIGTPRLFAASGTAFYDVTAAGVAGAAVQTGLANARWQHVNFGTPGGSYLYAVNGFDAPRVWDGAAWTAITGTSTYAVTNPPAAGLAALASVSVFKSRLYFIEKNSMNAYYLPVNSIGGALSSALNFGSLFRQGGSLLGMWNWTIDGGNGPDDYAAFVSSEGELALFQGTDPSNASAWALKGMFRIGKPVGGYRCAFRYKGNPAILCSNGLLPMVAIAEHDDADVLTVAISSKIVTAFEQAASAYGANFGWQGVFYPKPGLIMINVPATPNGVSYQFVMNTNTQAWCRYTGMTANCLGVFQGSLYLGRNQTVTLYDTGTSDNGAQIVCEAKPAWSDFGVPGREKQWQMMRLLAAAPTPVTFAVRMNTDFANAAPLANPAAYTGALAKWNVTRWNSTPWYGGVRIRAQWIAVNGTGMWGAPYIRAISSANGGQMAWYSTDHQFTVGNTLYGKGAAQTSPSR